MRLCALSLMYCVMLYGAFSFVCCFLKRKLLLCVLFVMCDVMLHGLFFVLSCLCDWLRLWCVKDLVCDGVWCVVCVGVVFVCGLLSRVCVLLVMRCVTLHVVGVGFVWLLCDCVRSVKCMCV